jgi:hypothetical protein
LIGKPPTQQQETLMAGKSAAKKNPPKGKTQPAIEEAPTFVEVAEETFLGDLMQCVLNQVKAIQKPWQQLSEAEQDSYLLSMEAQMRDATRKAMSIITAQDRTVLPVKVIKVVFKDGVKAEVELVAGSPGRHELADSEGTIVQIMIADIEHLTGGREGVPTADKDQPSLLDGEDEPRE